MDNDQVWGVPPLYYEKTAEKAQEVLELKPVLYTGFVGILREWPDQAETDRNRGLHQLLVRVIKDSFGKPLNSENMERLTKTY